MEQKENRSEHSKKSEISQQRKGKYEPPKVSRYGSLKKLTASAGGYGGDAYTESDPAS